MVRAVEHFEISYLSRFIVFIIVKVFRYKSRTLLGFNLRYFNGKQVFVYRAPEPTDIYWENLNLSFLQRLKRIFFTFALTFVVLACALGINIGIFYLKIELQDVANKQKGGTSNGIYWVVRFLTIFVSFFTSFVNAVLGRVIRIFSSHEKHATYSDYHLSVAIKLSIAMFLNTGIIPILSNVWTGNWFTSGGLVNDVFYKILAVGFISPIFYVFTLPCCCKRGKIWYHKYIKKSKSKMT